MDNKPFVVLFLVIISMSFVSAVWYNPFTWFSSSEDIKTIEKSNLIIENQYKLTYDDPKINSYPIKDTICTDESIKDNANQLSANLKEKGEWECVKIDDSVKDVHVGSKSDIYELAEVIVYEGDGFNITASLKNETNYLSGAVVDGLKFHYGGTEWQDMTYTWSSELPINNYRGKYGFVEGDIMHIPDTKDICSQQQLINETYDKELNITIREYKTANCQFNTWTENGENHLSVDFYGNDTDPVYTKVNLDQGLNTNTTTAYNLTWLNMTDSSPYGYKLYMPFDVNTSSLSVDFSLNANDGTINGANWTSSGKFGGAYTFNGISDYISCGDSDSLTITGDEISISVWIYPESQPSTNTGIVHKWGSNKGYLLFRREQQVWWFVESGSVFSTGTIVENEWNHIVAVYNGTNRMVYINGVLDDLDAWTTDLTDSGADFEIGKYSGNEFKGGIDEVMVLNYALNSTQVTNIYNNQSSRFVESGNYTFNQTISSGDNRVNVSTWIQNLKGSQVGLRVWDGTSWTDEQNITALDNYTFTIDDTTETINLTYTLYSGDYNFYTPIIYDNITIDTFTGGTPPADTCTYTSGDWEVDCADNCSITDPVDLGGNDISIIGYGTFLTTADITGWGKLFVQGEDSDGICSVRCSGGGCFK